VRAIAALLAVALATSAPAHPIHEVVQNAYLTLSPGTVDLQLELTAGPKVAGKIVAALDSDGDGRISPAEAKAYATRVLQASRLSVDGRPLVLRLASIYTPTAAAILGAHGTIRIGASAARHERAGAATLDYRNGYSPSESRCDANIFLKPGVRLTYQVIAQNRSRDGRDLHVRFRTAHR
jgi:hypothetical protein